MLGSADATGVPATDGPAYFTDQSAPQLLPNVTLGSTHNTLTPVGLDDDVLLDDLWSMMDWNVGFSSMDPSSIMPGI